MFLIDSILGMEPVITGSIIAAIMAALWKVPDMITNSNERKSQTKLGMAQIGFQEKELKARTEAAAKLREHLEKMSETDWNRAKEGKNLDFNNLLAQIKEQAAIVSQQSTQEHGQTLETMGIQNKNQMAMMKRGHSQNIETMGLQNKNAQDMARMAFGEQRLLESTRQDAETHRELIRGIAGLSESNKYAPADRFRSYNDIPLNLLLE